MTSSRSIGITAARSILARVRSIARAQDGSMAVEYGLIAALVVVVLIVALTKIREGLLGLPFSTLFAAFTEALL